MDIRNRVMYKKIGDVEYDLVADYNTIADIQAAFGDLNVLFNSSAYLRVAAVALTSMLNGCAHRHRWPKHFDVLDVSQYMPPITELRRTAGVQNRFCAGAHRLADAVQRHGGKLLVWALSAPPERAV